MQKLLKIAVASLVVTLMASGTVSAAQRMVNTTVDDPNLPGSLRFEIRFAQNGDTILFDQGLLDQQIVLKAEYGPLYIYKALSIVGDINQDGFADVSISGNNLTSLVYAMGPSSGEVVLEGLDLRDGYSKYSGGCIRNYSYGPLVIRNSIITHCEALRDGGAIYNVKTLVVEGSVIAENKAVRGAGIVTFSGVQPIISESEFHHNFSTRWGGAIYSYGDGILQIDRSMISDNYARGAGAGVFLHGAAPGFGVIINDSTINSNFCEGTDTDEDLEGVGGGISAGGRGSVVVNNSTISHNSAGRDGGGIMLRNEGPREVRHSTIAFNRADVGGLGPRFAGNNHPPGGEHKGAGIQTSPGFELMLSHVLFGENGRVNYPSVGGLLDDVTGDVFSEGFNLFQQNNITFIGAPGPGDILAGNGDLLPLSFYGGRTLTHMPGLGSAAINAGNPTLQPGAYEIPPFDQRGVQRVSGGVIDIGSVEIQ